MDRGHESELKPCFRSGRQVSERKLCCRNGCHITGTEVITRFIAQILEDQIPHLSVLRLFQCFLVDAVID